jgi:hypothetical protein
MSFLPWNLPMNSPYHILQKSSVVQHSKFDQLMSGLGQNEKVSQRAFLDRCTPESGHCSARFAWQKSAISGLMHRSKSVFIRSPRRRRGCGMAPGGARAAKVIKEANIYVRTCGHRRTYVGYSLTRKSEVGFRGQTGNHHGEGGAERAIADPRSL